MKIKRIIALLICAVLLCGTLISCEDDPGYYLAEISVSGYGKITVLLDGVTAPKTVRNFVSLAEDGFYDGLTFHRIIPNFMIQGGDPNGDGTGGSEDTIVGEFSENGYTNNISHVRGVISMARSEDMDSASSQFFICNADARASLDGKYAAFGYVIEGMDVVDKITDEVFPKTYLAEFYGNYSEYPSFNGATYHDVWAYYGNGRIVNDADKPVIEYVKVTEYVPPEQN